MSNEVLELAAKIAAKYGIEWEEFGSTWSLVEVTSNISWILRQDDKRGIYTDIFHPSLVALLERWARIELEKAGYYPGYYETTRYWFVKKRYVDGAIVQHKNYLYTLFKAVWKLLEANDGKA